VKREKQAHGGELVKAEKGDICNPAGRPVKYISTLKEQGYTLSQIVDCLTVMLTLTLDELEEIHKTGIYKGNKCTALEQILASAMRKDKARGELYNILPIITRAFGQPKQSIEHSGTITEITISRKNESGSNKGI
jgi:hypothetical protein